MPRTSMPNRRSARVIGVSAIGLVLALLAALLNPIAATAAVPGSVAGVVTLSTGAVGKGVSVQLVALAADGSPLTRDPAQKKVTSATGTFSIPSVRPGRYTLEFGALAGHGLQFLGGVTTTDAADVFVVSENRSSYIRAGITAGATLAVSVKGTNGKAAAGTVITAYAQTDRGDWTARGTATTGKTGAATLSLTPAIYRLFAKGPAFPPVFSGNVQSVSNAYDVTVARGRTTAFAFVAPSTGGVSGLVAGSHDGITVPKLAGIPVSVLRLSGTPGSYYAAQPIASTVTTATGAFSVSGLLPGFDYTLRFSPPRTTAAGVALNPRYGATLLGGTSTLNSATTFTVTAGAVTAVGTRTLTEAGDVTGTVLAYPGFAPAANVPVFARMSGENNMLQLPGQEITRTRADGSFTITGLGAGQWFIQSGSASEEMRVSTTLNGNNYPNVAIVEVVAGTSTALSGTMYATVVNGGDEATLFTPTTISGTPQVGQMLTATPPVYHYGATSDPVATGGSAAVWLRNGRAIPGAVGSTYTLTGADVGALISAKVHAAFLQRPWAASESAAVTVQPGPAPTALTQASISAARKVGTPIVVTPGTYALPGTTTTYEWCVDANDNGDCDGPTLGTGPAFTPSAAQLGAEILVRISATRAGYGTLSVMRYVGVITVGALTNVKAPSVTKKGTVLTANPGTWSALGSIYGYGWSVFDPATQNWVVLAPTTPSINASAYGGRAIRVLVTASQAGFSSGTAQATAQVGTPGLATGATTLPATVSPSTLSAPAPTWASDTDSSSTTVSWQWQYLKGKKWLALAGRTASTLVIPESYIGKSIRVVITARTTGFAPKVHTTNPSVVVISPAPTATLDVSNSGSPKVGLPMVVSLGTWTTPGVAVKYAWQSRPSGGGTFTAIPKATSATYKPTEADHGRELRVVITGTKKNFRTATLSGIVGVVGNGTLHLKAAGELSDNGSVYSITPPTFVEGPAAVASIQWSAITPGGSTTVLGTGLTWPVAGLETKQVLAFVTMSRAKYGVDQTWVVGTSPASLQIQLPGTLTYGGGVARVGQTVTVSNGTFSGLQPQGYTYQWQYSHPVTNTYTDIPGAVNQTYTIDRAYVGRTLVVQVLGHHSGYNSRGFLLETAAVEPGFGLNPGLGPVLTTDAKVGVPITATTGGAWSEPATFSYEWKLDGVTVGTKSTYIPLPADRDRTLAVTVTGKVPGLASAVRGGSTVVQSGTLAVTKNPVVSKKGTVLSVTAATWSKKPSSVQVSWNIYDRTNGTSVVVTAAKLNVAAHAGKRITATLTATLDGYAPGVKTVAAQTGRAAAFVPGTDGIILANTTMASAFNLANPIYWDMDAATTSFQWTRNGKAIAGATAVDYSFTPADTGTKLAVVITKASPGYASAPRSFAVPFVTPAVTALAATVAPSISGSAVVHGTLTASTGVWSSPGVTYTYQWYTADGVSMSILNATGATLVPGPELAGSSVFVRVTASKPYFASVYAESNRVAIGFGAAPVAAKPADITRAGDVLTATLGALTPGFTTTVQWFRVNGGVATPIAGETGISLSTTSADLGSTFRAVFTATRPGHPTTTFASPDVIRN